MTDFDKPGDLKPLTSLRFFAALMVVALHVDEFAPPQRHTLPPGLIQGVSFFFVLSGFILTHVYNGGRKVTLRDFLAKRFARIYPTHIAAMALSAWAPGLTTISQDAGLTVVAVLAKLTLTDAWFPIRDVMFSWNPVSWSLSTEAGFYIAFPFLLADLRKSWAFKLALGMLVCYATFIITGSTDWALETHSSTAPNIAFAMYAMPTARGMEFILGMVSYLVWFHVIRRMAIPTAVWTLLECLLLALSAWLVITPSTSLSASVFIQLVLRSSAGAPAFALLIVMMASSRGVLGRLLAGRTFVWLGEVSFALYLVHEPVLRFLGPMAFMPVQFLLVLALSLIVAAAMHHLIEIPARRRILALGSARVAAA